MSIAFAWISGPAISPAGQEVGWVSCSTGAVAPITTILSRKVPGGYWRRTARENDTSLKWPGGPAKSIQAPPPANQSGSTGRRVAFSTVATDSVFRPSIL